MIRRAVVILCDNEHGIGDVTFPPMPGLTPEHFAEPLTVTQLRKKAKEAGWSRERGIDYCDMCTENEKLARGQK